MTIANLAALLAGASAARTSQPLDVAQVVTIVIGVPAAIVACITIWSVLKRAMARRRVVLMPTITDRFVERQELTDRIVELLRAPKSSSVAVIAALRGAGGFGKTTLAAHVCQLLKDDFPGGILWVTLGDNLTSADVATKVNDLVFHLTRERPTIVDAEQAGHHLGRVLGDRRRLLVVDDVWNPAHLAPFLSGGADCRRLVTTRIDSVLPPGTPRVEVDAMEHDQALALLTDGLGQGARSAMARLVPRTGGWPILLSLVNGAVRGLAAREGTMLDDAARHVEAVLAAGGPVTFDPPLDLSDPSARSRAVGATVEASLKLLEASGRGRLERYEELAVFPEDTEIPTVTLARYWQHTGDLDASTVDRLCRDLADLSLVQARELPPVPGLRLHDVLRTYLVRRVGPVRLAALHRALLDAHRPATPDQADGRPTEWWTMAEDEPYLWRNLFHHLREAADGDAAHGELVTLGCNLRWVEGKLRRLGPAALDADFRLVPGGTAANLRAVLAQDAHLLGPLEPDHALGATLLARLSGRPDLGEVVRKYEEAFGHPRLAPVWPLPDLPDPSFRRALMSSHKATVTAVAISPDGSWLASGGSDGTVRVWNIAQGTLRATFTGHNRGVKAVAISPDGSWLASGGSDGTVRLWNVAEGALRATFTGHDGGVNALAIGPDGSWLASAGGDAKVCLWDVAKGTLRATFTGHDGGVNALAIGPDGSWLASAGEDGRVRLWDVAKGMLRSTITGNGGMIAMAISPDGSWLACAPRDGTVRLWDLAKGRPGATLTDHQDLVRTIAISPDGSWLASASNDGTVRLWDVAEGTPKATLAGHVLPVYAMAISPDGSWLASAGEDGMVRLWDVAEGRLRATVTNHDRAMTAVTISPDGSLLAFGGFDRMVRLWEIAEGKLRATFTGHDYWVNAVAISPDGSWLASATHNEVRLWDVAQGTLRATLTGHAGWVKAVAISPDGSWLASAVDNGTVGVWDVAEGTLRATLTSHDASGEGVAISPDGSWLASTGRNKVLLWNVAEGTLRATLTGHDGWVKAVAISPDGSWLAAASANAVRLWDVTEGTLRATLTSHDRSVNALAISPDGSWLASASDDGTVRVWSISTASMITSLRTDSYLSACCWSPVGPPRIGFAGGTGVGLLELVQPGPGDGRQVHPNLSHPAL